MVVNDSAAQTARDNRASRGWIARWWRIWATGGVDHDAVLRQIAEDAGWSGRYAFLIVVSAAIALIGLLMPSVAVVIGAMLLSPLMMPIIGLGFGIATLDLRAVRRAAIALVAGSVIAIALSAALVAISPIQTITSEIAARTRPTLFDLMVALLSALAGAYALIRGRGGTVVGVAIATALMPPLAVVGFGVGTGNATVFAGSLLLFLTNAITIALTAALVARVYGFGSHLSRHHTGWQLALFVAALSVLSVPLGAALRQIAFEALAQRQVRDAIRARFPDGARLGEVEMSTDTPTLRVRAVVLTPRIDPAADRGLSSELAKRLSTPVDLHVDQLLVPVEGGAAEAAQIAQAGDSVALAAEQRRDRAIADVALIAGAAPDSVVADAATRRLRVTAAALSGLTVAGYRELEARAAAAVPDWQVRLVPPAELEPPVVPIRDGVVDSRALDNAAWGSARLGRIIEVSGGLAAQRAAIVDGIVARGGRAEAGTAAGGLRFGWSVPEQPEQPAAAPQPGAAAPAR